MKLKTALSLAAGLTMLAGLAPSLSAQDAASPPRPRLTGIAHVTLFVHDIEQSRLFYKDFLGYDEVHPRTNPAGKLLWTFIKINDRQFLELYPEKKAGTDRLFQLSLQTDDAEAMRVYLKSKGVKVPDKVSHSMAGDDITIEDPEGHSLLILSDRPDAWIIGDHGKDLPDTRISHRMSHVGLMVHNLDATEKFYRDILGCTETWRGSKNGKTLSWVNLKLPDGNDYLEFMLYGNMPRLADMNRMHHICLEVPSVPKAAEILKTRTMPEGSKPATNIATGVNGKRQINYYDPDGTRVEVMERTTVDGKPRPPSDAPPPGS